MNFGTFVATCINSCLQVWSDELAEITAVNAYWCNFQCKGVDNVGGGGGGGGVKPPSPRFFTINYVQSRAC